MSDARRGLLRGQAPNVLARWSVKFSPEAASLSEGLRAAAACASLAAIAVVGHDPNLAWAAVMAFWTCMVDPGGPNRIRARMLGLFTVAGTFVAVLSAGVASFGTVPAACALLLIATICSFLRVYGAEAATLSNLLVVCAVVTIARPLGDPRALLTFAGLCLTGCLWASLLSLTVWRIHPYAAARTALGQAYRRLAAMAVDLAKTASPTAAPAHWSAHAQHHRGGVRLAIEEARRLTLQAVGGRNDQENISVAGALVLAALATAETEFACLIALSDVLERDGPGEPAQQRRTTRLIMQIASVMHRLDRLVEATDGDPAPLKIAAKRLMRAAEAAPAHICRLVAPMAAEALHIAEDDIDDVAGLSPAPSKPVKPLAERLWGPIRANLTWNSIFLRHTARVSICVTGAYLLAEGFKLPYGYWMTTTVVLIQQPYLYYSGVRAVERVLGGVLGGGLAALLGMMFHSQLSLLLLMFPLAMACMSFRAVNYSLFVLFLTPLFVLILDLTHPGVREPAIAGIRAINTVIGGAIALAGSLLLWPGSEGDRLKLALADAIERNGRLAGVALSTPGEDVGPIRTARREAGLASNKADEARRRAALEIWWRRAELKAADEVLAAVRRLAGTAVALWLDGQPMTAATTDHAIGAWSAQASADAARAVREGSRLPPDPPPAPPPGRAEPIIAEIQALYRAARPLAGGE
ncbi:MAG TPA: FUSC family protein [Caulobacteraceae bacterium]|nr:FUSC family protein [Caulobacteraceae bacterium]